MNFNDLKQYFKSDDLHLFLGEIKRLHLDEERSYLKVDVLVWPEERLIVADMTWEFIGSDAGFYNFPSVGDAVLCGSAEGDVDQSFVIKRLSSNQDKIPEEAINGDSILKALAGKNIKFITDSLLRIETGGDAHINSSGKIGLAKSNTMPTQNLVLGQEFKDAYSDHLSKLMDVMDSINDFIDQFNLHTSIGNLGYPTGAPLNIAAVTAVKTAITALKASVNGIKTGKVDNETILSDLSFTEK